MSLILNVPEFWIYQSSENASGFEYVMILNIEGLHRVQKMPE